MTQTLSIPRPAPPRSARQRHAMKPDVLLVGASTGGPQALVVLIAGLAPLLERLPVCVTLHLPSNLMPVIATHISRTCGATTEVVTGDRELEPGIVYFAPGDRHLAFRRDGGKVKVVLMPVAPGALCSHAIDVMFKSGASCFGPRTLGVVLSGMGKDGLEGAHAIVAAGGSVLVQDKATSAVWGMPGAVANANLAAAILEPAAMARAIAARTTRVGKSA